MYAEIIVDVTAAEVDRVFTYRVPDGVSPQVGSRVLVPFGPKQLEGYVLRLKETADYDEAKIKNVLSCLEEYPALLKCQIALAEQIVEKTHCPLCSALRLMLPPQMRGGRVNVKTERVAQLLVSSDAFAQARAAQTRSKKRRILLDLLSDGEAHPVSELGCLVKSPLESLKELQEQGAVTLFEREVLRTPYGNTRQTVQDPVLTAEQADVLSVLLAALMTGRGAFLLHGVTGSGKTEVFIRLVREAMQQGKGAIVLVPEIVLTPQMVGWFRARFGDVSAVLHSRLSPGERYDEWRRIRTGQARVVIGARSAVFAPVENLGVIVVDEEHEQSYLSDHFPQYDAREIAQWRAKRERAVLLLASATPSILSFAKTGRGDYQLLEMQKRVNLRPLPEITLADMRQELRLGNKSMFSLVLQDKLARVLKEGTQAMLFINRRGYAPFVTCRQCGYTVKCDSCDVTMTYHRDDNAMHCHYCGQRRPLPTACPVCGSPYIRACGLGTQRVEEEVRKLYPSAVCLRMDNDTMTGKDAHYELLNRFRSGQAQVLVGTQMIAKGLDFPNVALVGAVLADLTLSLPDYRAPERTFQLLVQVAGRAGRASVPGEVIVQTYMPEHYAIKAAVTQDYRAFFNEEFARRRQNLYPPFTMMARLLAESTDIERARAASGRLKEALEAFLAQNPAQKKRLLYLREDEAPINRIMGRARAQVLCKLLEHPDSDKTIVFMQALAKDATDAQVTLEINPSSLA